VRSEKKAFVRDKGTHTKIKCREKLIFTNLKKKIGVHEVFLKTISYGVTKATSINQANEEPLVSRSRKCFLQSLRPRDAIGHTRRGDTPSCGNRTQTAHISVDAGTEFSQRCE